MGAPRSRQVLRSLGLTSKNPIVMARGGAALAAIAVVASVASCGEVSSWSLGQGALTDIVQTGCDGACGCSGACGCDGACDCEGGCDGGVVAPSACEGGADGGCSLFGAPTAIAELATPGTDIEKPTLCCGMLQMFFLTYSKAGPGSGDVWQTTRTSTSSAWTPPVLVTAVSTSFRETSPAVSYDGKTLWVASDRTGGQGGLDIWVSTRAAIDGTWSAPVLATALNSINDEIPRPPGDHDLVMPISWRTNANSPYQIYTANRAALDAVWAAPVFLRSIDTASLDDDGFLTDDGLTLYFSSDRGKGAQDLYVSTRPQTTSDFGTAQSMDVLNAGKSSERDPWVSPDGREIYFTSDRSGTLEIYHAAR